MTGPVRCAPAQAFVRHRDAACAISYQPTQLDCTRDDFLQHRRRPDAAPHAYDKDGAPLHRVVTCILGQLQAEPPRERVEIGTHVITVSCSVTFATKPTCQRLPRMSAYWGRSQPVDATLYLRGKRWSVGWNGDFR